MFPTNNQNSEHSPGHLPPPTPTDNIDSALVSPATKKSLFKRSKEDGMDRYVPKVHNKIAGS